MIRKLGKFNKESKKFGYISLINYKPKTSNKNPTFFEKGQILYSSQNDIKNREKEKISSLHTNGYEKYKISKIFERKYKINDNKHLYLNNLTDDNISIKNKINKDYNSNIYCLPGCKKNNLILKTSVFRGWKNLESSKANLTTRYNIHKKLNINIMNNNYYNDNKIFGKRINSIERKKYFFDKNFSQIQII
jgi:hypothetical protein